MSALQRGNGCVIPAFIPGWGQAGNQPHQTGFRHSPEWRIQKI